MEEILENAVILTLDNDVYPDALQLTPNNRSRDFLQKFRKIEHRMQQVTNKIIYLISYVLDFSTSNRQFTEKNEEDFYETPATISLELLLIKNASWTVYDV